MNEINKTPSKSRQIPSSRQYCADRKYADILYAYLQYQSRRDWDENQIEKGPRYLLRSDINFTAFAAALDMSRQTVSKKFQYLQDLKLIEYVKEEDKYYLTVLPKQDATLIPYDLLEFMVDTFSDRAYSVYCYLFNRYWANSKQPFDFTYDQIKTHLGLCTNTRSNDHVVSNILIMLANNHLITYSLQTKTGEDQGNVKTIYQLKSISNKKPEIQKKDEC
jgi:hypothetical protein